TVLRGAGAGPRLGSAGYAAHPNPRAKLAPAGAGATAAPRRPRMANGRMDASGRGPGRISGPRVSSHPMKFIVDVTHFDRAETVEVEASGVAEALRQACEKTNVSVKIGEVGDPKWARVEGFKSIP